MAPWDRRDSETASTVVGSESGHRLTEQDDATEDTGLLSAGAQQHNGAEDSPLGESIHRKDSWVGMQDFEGLPWHQRPSVRMSLAKPTFKSSVMQHTGKNRSHRRRMHAPANSSCF